MGQILVRNLDDAVIERLKAKARENGKSLEQTAREVLADASRNDREELLRFAEMIRERSKARGQTFDPVDIVRRDRDAGQGREWP